MEQELPAYGEGDAACDRDFHKNYMKGLKEEVVMQRVKWLDMDVRKMTDREFQEQWALMKTQILRLTAA